MQAITKYGNDGGIPVSEFLMWALVAILAILLVAILTRFINKSRRGNAVFYEQKGAINLRLQKLPDLRIATKHCKDFHMEVRDKTMLLSYANPIGGKKEFKCKLVGEPCKQPILVKFTEQEFRKLCINLKPGKIAIRGRKVLLNYNLTVKAYSVTKLRREED